MFVTAALSAVADFGTSESRVRDMAAYQAASSIAISVGPGLGGLAAAHWGYAAPFVLQSIFAVLAVAMVGAAAGSAAARDVAPKPKTKASIAALDRRLAGGVAVLTYGALFGRVSANWVLLPLVGQATLGMDVAEIGLMLTAGAVTNLVVLPLVNPATRRFGRLAMTIASCITTIFSVLLLAGAHAPFVGFISACLLGASSGTTMPLLSAYAIDAAPPGAVGTAMGMLRTVTDFGIVTGPVIAGVIVDRAGFGYAGGLWFTALILAVSVVVFWLAVRKRPS
jgi:MFS family permease